MSQQINLANKKYGAWTVLSYHGSSKWECRCDCGTTRLVAAQTLRVGASKGCGCTKRVAISKARTIHGHAVGWHETKTYQAWKSMHKRCRSKGKEFVWYGALGIKVCDRWADYRRFLEDMGECPSGLTLDRINTFGGYEPSNCRWATWKEQRLNQRRNYS